MKNKTPHSSLIEGNRTINQRIKFSMTAMIGFILTTLGSKLINFQCGIPISFTRRISLVLLSGFESSVDQKQSKMVLSSTNPNKDCVTFDRFIEFKSFSSF